MKVVEFIKRNISFFSVIGSAFFIFFLLFVLTYKFNTNENHLIGFIIAFVLFIGFSLFLLFDLILKKSFSSRLKLAIFQLLITLILLLLFYFNIYKLL